MHYPICPSLYKFHGPSTGYKTASAIQPAISLAHFATMPNLPLPSLRPDGWLTRRLANVAEFSPRFEASWYGPYNALLSHYFPYQQHFLVKPQPRVRAVQPEIGDISFSSIQADSSTISSDEANFSADLSMTSMGNFAVHGGSTIVPDFIVTKATEFASHDKALLLVEVKPCMPDIESDMVAYEYQMDSYMDRIAEQLEEGRRLVGLLVCGTEVTISRLDGPECAIQVDQRSHDINSTTIRELLLDIARDNWDY
ncbi:hypothetical protein EV363DRAFT_1219313 [Boletus edulis]|uniref:Uncharacterized protein n=1 Tax=Boletus edulis BED1 TaxID=1328754 RepID=A0AAD4BC85_BOLED|nr:hypothetical protein EV363DRAFT_1219313 [Boletus edulis]KAF8418470.1 hypothetical protein L210DRAFT_3579100 [Boletus edulis BED1]